MRRFSEIESMWIEEHYHSSDKDNNIILMDHLSGNYESITTKEKEIMCSLLGQISECQTQRKKEMVVHARTQVEYETQLQELISLHIPRWTEWHTQIKSIYKSCVEYKDKINACTSSLSLLPTYFDNVQWNTTSCDQCKTNPYRYQHIQLMNDRRKKQEEMTMWKTKLSYIMNISCIQ